MLNQYEVFIDGYTKTLKPINQYDIEDINPCTNDAFDKMCIFRDYIHLSEMNNEHIYIMANNEYNQLMGIYMAGTGDSFTAGCSLKSIALFLMMMNAQKFEVIHNHPLGDLTPSDNDKMLKQNLFQLGTLIDIYLTGCYIISEQGYYNMSNGDSFKWEELK